jgi:hypothetical protein
LVSRGAETRAVFSGFTGFTEALFFVSAYYGVAECSKTSQIRPERFLEQHTTNSTQPVVALFRRGSHPDKFHRDKN